MLVLTRSAGEVLQIGRNIFVQIIEIRGDNVRVGLHAPPELPILRHECGFDETAPLPPDIAALAPPLKHRRES